MSTQVRSQPKNGLFTGLRSLPNSVRPPLLAETLPIELSENSTLLAFLSSFFASSPISNEILEEFVRQMQKFPNLDALVFESVARIHYPPKSVWFKALLKRLIYRMDKFGLDPSDILYQKLCALMVYDSEDGQDDSFFRIFPDFLCANLSQAPYILIKQRIHHISHGTTGLSCWTASSVLANFLTHSNHCAIFSSFSHVLELGAGCGLAGISFAAANVSSRVTLTDAHPTVLQQLQENVTLNFDRTLKNGRPAISVERLDWTDYEQKLLPKGVDLVIAADVIFDPSLFRPFAQLLQHLLWNKNVTGSVVSLICCTVRDKSTVQHFLRVIGNHKISVRAQYNCFFRNGICGSQIAFIRTDFDGEIGCFSENDLSQCSWFQTIFPIVLSCNSEFPVVIFEFDKLFN